MDTDFLAGIPFRPFALREGERLQRPEEVQRLGFEQVYPRAYQSHTGPLARAIVPIELAQPGDRQVAVLAGTGKRASRPYAIDSLAGLPEVVSVVAARAVRARRRLPHIRELFLVDPWASVDEETLANLPGLVSLSLGEGFGERKLDLNVLRRMPGLRDLRFHAWAVGSIEPLRNLEGLARLRIEGITPEERSATPLAGLSSLRWLALEARTGLRSLKGLVNLERVELMEASFANLKAFEGWTKVRWLALSGRGIQSLEGIQAMRSLDDLFLGGIGARDLEPLAALPELQGLKLVSADRVSDFSPLGRIENLRSLVIQMGSISRTDHLRSIDFAAGLGRLEALEIRGAVIDDGRLEALFDLPEIRRVRLLGNFGDQVERLRRHKPGCEIQITPLILEEGMEEYQIGGTGMRKFADGSWSIFQDLSDVLGVENNFDADQRVQQAIRTADPALFKRLRFDPDADFVLILAEREGDIRQAAELIQGLFVRR